MKAGAVAVAVALLAAAWVLALATGRFSAHMTAHVVAVAVAAPLLAAALPLRDPRLQAPAVALMLCGVEFMVVWGWHAPLLHDAARGALPLFLLEQLSFLAVGYGLWASVLQAGAPVRRRARSLAGAGALLLTSMHMTLLGALLTLAPRILYGHGGAAGGVWDQQLGGLIMLCVGGTVYLGGALWLLAAALRQPPPRWDGAP